MSLPTTVRQQVEPIIADYCAKKVPEHLRHKLKMGFEIRGQAVTLIEERPHWRDPSQWTKTPIAQFRYDDALQKWTLYCADRNSRWHNYEAKPAKDIRVLLQEVDSDPTGIFWG